MDLDEEIEKLKNTDKAIIVEGKKDKAALESFGISGIVTLDRPIFEVCEAISKIHSDAIILTDLDKEGKRLYSKIKDNLARNGVRVDDRFRNFLFRETELRQIEGLASYAERIR